MAKKQKGLMTTLAILALVGGLVHVLQPIGFDLLNILPLPGVIQFVAGVGTVWFAGSKLMKYFI